MSAYEIPRNASHSRDYTAEFRLLPNQLNVVNHSEFESAVAKVKRQAEVEDDVYPDFQKATVLAVQRCRRGGKTFMLHKIAAEISTELPLNSHVVFISLNSVSTYDSSENAYTAILSRIAWELTGRPGTFRQFRRSFTDFGEIDDWLLQARVILIVDELNSIKHTQPGYEDMSSLLDNLAGRKGSTLLYSTHHRGTSDLLRGRRPEGDNACLVLSKRHHVCLPIPRIQDTACLLGISLSRLHVPSFWCAVQRGRVPVLILQSGVNLTLYAADAFEDRPSEDLRKRCLAAVVTGQINNLQTASRNNFRAYSYMSERFVAADSDDPLFAWPPFMVAQSSVLGKTTPIFALRWRILKSTRQRPLKLLRSFLFLYACLLASPIISPRRTPLSRTHSPEPRCYMLQTPCRRRCRRYHGSL